MDAKETTEGVKFTLLDSPAQGRALPRNWKKLSGAVFCAVLSICGIAIMIKVSASKDTTHSGGLAAKPGYTVTSTSSFVQEVSAGDVYWWAENYCCIPSSGFHTWDAGCEESWQAQQVLARCKLDCKDKKNCRCVLSENANEKFRAIARFNSMQEPFCAVIKSYDLDDCGSLAHPANENPPATCTSFGDLASNSEYDVWTTTFCGQSYNVEVKGEDQLKWELFSDAKCSAPGPRDMCEEAEKMAPTVTDLPFVKNVRASGCSAVIETASYSGDLDEEDFSALQGWYGACNTSCEAVAGDGSGSGDGSHSRPGVGSHSGSGDGSGSGSGNVKAYLKMECTSAATSGATVLPRFSTWSLLGPLVSVLVLQSM